MDQQCRLEGQEEATTGPDSREQRRGSPSPNPALPGAQHHGQHPSAPCASSGQPGCTHRDMAGGLGWGAPRTGSAGTGPVGDGAGREAALPAKIRRRLRRWQQGRNNSRAVPI